MTIPNASPWIIAGLRIAIPQAMGAAYSGVDFECSGQVDVRGPKGVPGIRPYFEKVKLKTVLHTDEAPPRVEKLQQNVAFRCPVMNLLRSADVAPDVTWEIHPAE